MESIGEEKCSSGYGKPPWIFRGRALYQLHLVKAETARACIPKEFSLIEAFGYTLGGFFLASYDDSPAGIFDELVVISGLLKSGITSCAWAAKVLVNSDEACDHGRKEVGLPSQVARFSKRISAIPRQEKSKYHRLVDLIGLRTAFSSKNHQVEDIQVAEINGPSVIDIYKINLTTSAVPFNQWMGPMIKMSLPSYSGGTEYTPNLLKYSCQIECRVRAVKPAKVTGLLTMPKKDGERDFGNDYKNREDLTRTREEDIDHDLNLTISVMLAKPILALEFSNMKMKVEAPVVISSPSLKTA